MLWLKLLRSLFKALSASEHPNQIAGGFALGFAAGLTPGWPIQVWLIVFVTLLFNVNLGLAIAGAGVAAAIGWIFDPAIEPLGRWLLTGVEGLKPLWTTMYNSPFWLLTRFNNTTVMGSAIATLILTPVVFVVLRVVFVKYQQKIREMADKWRFLRWIRASRVYGFIERVMG